MNHLFSFERLDVYQRALGFSKKVLNLIKEVKGHYSWCNQFNRAATSIALNIAEGAGRWHASLCNHSRTPSHLEKIRQV